MIMKNKIDVFCEVTNNDEVNIMSSILAKKMGARKVVTLINDPTNYFTFEKAGYNATTGEITGGGFPVSAGPVTITP